MFICFFLRVSVYVEGLVEGKVCVLGVREPDDVPCVVVVRVVFH